VSTAVATGAPGSTDGGATPGTATAASPSTSAPAASGSAGGGKPCYHPAGFDHFFKLNSAEVDQGDTRLNVTEVSCLVDPDNDEIVKYTPIRSTSMLVHAGARVQVLSGTGNPHTVQAGWLVDNKLSNSPYFYYQANTEHQVTAMQEIYHP